MPFCVIAADGRVICVHTEVGGNEATRVVVQEGEHHYEAEPLDYVDED